MALRQRILATPRLYVVGLFVLVAACNPRGTSVVTAKAGPSMGPPTEVPPPAPGIMNAAALISAMHDRYRTTWYHSLTFVQQTTVAMPSGGDLVQTWYEAGELPGQLRIDTGLELKSGVIYARDSVFRFTNGKLTQSDTGMNELLVLGFDVYRQPPEVTERILRHLGFNFGLMHQTTWNGKPVYVVGAALGDTTTKQFWIEKERLLFVRMLNQGRRGQVDVRFDNYVPAGKAWIAMRVEQTVNGKRTLLEEYSDVKVDMKLSRDLFDPTKWATVAHWSK